METTQQQMMLLQKNPFCETVHPDDQQFVEESVRSLNIEHPHTNIFYRKRNPQGKWFYMQSDLSYLIVGKKKYIYVTYQDVSALQKNKELSNALHYSQKRDEELTKALRALGTVFTNMLIVHLEDRKAEWLKTQGDKKDILERFQDAYAIRDLISDNFMLPEYRQGYLEFTDLDTISERFENHKILRYIYRNRNKQWVALSAIVQNCDENGRVTDIQLLTHDVTDQREKELQQEDALRIALASAEHANKAKTAFLNNMSHDIRTPMNAIIGFTAIAATHMDQPELVKDYLTKISTSSQHLLSLINDVLDMSRIESGVVKIEEKEVCIPDSLHDLKTIIQGNIQAKQQELYIDTQDVVHENVITDRLRLNQILLNIVSNAIKFTPVGGMVNIRVSEKPCNRKGFTTFEFRIRDNGIGMSEEFQAHVFDSFSRERTSTQSGIKGTGFGMAITRNIVDMMGGTISLTSKEGKGTEFVVTLNFKILEKATVYGPIPELVGARTLVVDDDVHTCTSVSKMLREIEIRTLKNNKKANIPIIAMTANAFEEDKKKAFKAGMNAHIAKPIDIKTILAALEQVFGTL